MKKWAMNKWIVAGLAGMVAYGMPTYAAVPSYDAQALAAKDRPAADTARDTARHTLALLVLSTAKPGDRVLDFMPGGGFFTRLFSHVVGPKGHVFSVIPSELAKLMPSRAEAIKALAGQPEYANVSAVVEPTAQTGSAALAQGGALDVVWTSDNYHDVYGFFGANQAAALDAAIFKALKPGGVFVVVDHVALAGATTAPPKLHRIDPETVKAQVLAAGFVLDTSSDVLRNLADPHTAAVFAPAIKGHTDQFAFRFRKPAK
jgi:predicted methyltransferase